MRNWHSNKRHPVIAALRNDAASQLRFHRKTDKELAKQTRSHWKRVLLDAKQMARVATALGYASAEYH